MTNKSKKILSEISPGELLDKISILEIKREKITDENNLREVKKEYEMLKKIQNSSIEFDEKIQNLFNLIKNINTTLWNIEDKIRVHEKKKDFSKDFIELARNVYLNNDKRAKIKSEINNLLESNIKEVKQYTDY
jgi:adenine C2-methylase RlmN of 23S rRNA A2503 and tRNA A37